MVEAGLVGLGAGSWMEAEAGIGTGVHCAVLRGSVCVVVQADSRSTGRKGRRAFIGATLEREGCSGLRIRQGALGLGPDRRRFGGDDADPFDGCPFRSGFGLDWCAGKIRGHSRVHVDRGGAAGGDEKQGGQNQGKSGYRFHGPVGIVTNHYE